MITFQLFFQWKFLQFQRWIESVIMKKTSNVTDFTLSWGRGPG